MPADTLRTGIDMDLKDLEPLAKRLNAATDELNQALQTIQDKLNTMGVGVEVWVYDSLRETDRRAVLDQNQEPTGDREFDADELGYGRFGDEWVLLVRTRQFVETLSGYGYGNFDIKEEREDEPWKRKPLLRAARHLRSNAVPLIPKLIDGLKAEAEKVLQQIEQAKKIAASLK